MDYGIGYGFCECCDEKIVSTVVEFVKKIKADYPYDVEAQVTFVRDYFASDFKDTTFLNGFVGLAIDYINIYADGSDIIHIDNPFPEETKLLIKYCVKMLHMIHISNVVQKESYNKYLNIYDFVTSFLKIPDVKGYPYIVLQYLASADSKFCRALRPKGITGGGGPAVMKHGSSIRNGWLNWDLVELAGERTKDIPDEELLPVMLRST